MATSTPDAPTWRPVEVVIYHPLPSTNPPHENPETSSASHPPFTTDPRSSSPTPQLHLYSRAGPPSTLLCTIALDAQVTVANGTAADAQGMYPFLSIAARGDQCKCVQAFPYLFVQSGGLVHLTLRGKAEAATTGCATGRGSCSLDAEFAARVSTNMGNECQAPMISECMTSGTMQCLQSEA